MQAGCILEQLKVYTSINNYCWYLDLKGSTGKESVLYKLL